MSAKKQTKKAAKKADKLEKKRTSVKELRDRLIPEDSEVPAPKLAKELRKAAAGLNAHQARLLVDTYYQRQDARIRAQGQLRALQQGADQTNTSENASILEWLFAHELMLEEQIKLALGEFYKGHPMGKWLTRVKGVGPVIAAGLVAYIDIEEARTAGHIWNFAGLNPERRWNKGEKRPWCAGLKRLCFLLGESFVKQQGRDDAFYPDRFTEYKAEAVARNDSGGFAELAGGRDYKDTTGAYKWVRGHYPAGTTKAIQEIRLEDQRNRYLKSVDLGAGNGIKMIPPAHVHAYARRRVVKLFLSHFHKIWFEKHHGRPAPIPYALTPKGGHAHMIDAPYEDEA